MPLFSDIKEKEKKRKDDTTMTSHKTYKTTFTLKIVENPGDIPETKICKELHGINHRIFNDVFLHISNINRLCLSHPLAWTEHTSEMKKLSEKFPSVLFSLTGRGEKDDDIWIDYYKAGKMQHCRGKIVYEDFCQEKMS